MRLLALLVVMAAAASAGVTDSARTLEQKTAGLRPGLRQSFRLQAAESLRAAYAELARHLVDLTLADVRENGAVAGTIRLLAELAPDDALALLPKLPAGSDGPLVNDLLYSQNTDAALKLFRTMLARGSLPMVDANPMLRQLAKERPADAVQLFGEILARFPFEHHSPLEAWALLNCAGTMALLAPGPAADACERIAKAAADPEYGAGAPPTNYRFAIGAKDIATGNPREAVLMVAGARLRAIAPERFEKMKAVFAGWDLNAPLTVKGTLRMSQAAARAADPRVTDLEDRMRQLRGNLTDEQRAQLAIGVATGIRELPAGDTKTMLARSLANLSTEGDLGHDALNAVANTLAQSLHERPGSDDDAYLELASLIRYEHLTVSESDPAVTAAEALLALRDEIHQQTGFTLTALDGREYSLPALRGKVVLLNFWATWCPPCRKEMPDLEKLYAELGKKGLVVLAVSDEERETVTGYLEKQHYTFPILLDPGRKVHAAFDVNSIPRSFVFDREGRLAAQAIDMRTERQFRELLKGAGLE